MAVHRVTDPLHDSLGQFAIGLVEAYNYSVPRQDEGSIDQNLNDRAGVQVLLQHRFLVGIGSGGWDVLFPVISPIGGRLGEAGFSVTAQKTSHRHVETAEAIARGFDRIGRNSEVDVRESGGQLGLENP